MTSLAILLIIIVPLVLVLAYMNYHLYRTINEQEYKMDLIVDEFNAYNADIEIEEEKERFIALVNKLIHIWNK